MSRTKCQKRKLCSLLRRCQLHTVILCNKNCVVLHCTFDNQYMYIIVTERNTERLKTIFLGLSVHSFSLVLRLGFIIAQNKIGLCYIEDKNYNYNYVKIKIKLNIVGQLHH